MMRLPPTVVAGLHGGAVRHFPVEGVAEAIEECGRVLVEIEFIHGWIERRSYDPKTQQWEEREGIHRK